MNAGDLSDRMKPLVERLEREPRFSLAWTLAYCFVLPRVLYLPAEQWPAALDKATEELVAEIHKTNGVARIRRRSKGVQALLDRADRIARGEKVPDTRRLRKAKRRAA